ncbi:MAG: cysteine desulfurase, partial [Spirochaetaceae bacterium]|nr:cysteine desulfurase [Spirochaetaceae bacterium]
MMPVKHVYLDYNATAPVSGEVQKAIIEDLALYGNASSMHEAGRQARVRVEEARRNVAALVGAEAKDIIFTSGGSESNNTIFETMRRLVTEPALAKEFKLQTGRNEVITTEIEHPCVLNAAKYLKSIGVPVHFLPVDENGKIKMDEYRKVLSERTLLVSVMFANNEIGTIQNIAEIAGLAKEAGAWFHTDAVQAAGKIPVNVTALKIDYATFSGHKIYGPKGVGALYRRQGAPLLPLIHGGHQEDGFRAGTYNNIGILGYGAAAKAAKEKLTGYG